MANELNEALASLEVLMSEFFAPNTSNLRKREIESMLENFSNRRDSWRDCLIFLQKSENHYVLMYTLTTLENIINRQWITLSDTEKTEIRLTLWNELMAKHEIMVYFIRNKLASLMVSIARYDWPHLYPDFFDNIIQLIGCGGHRCLVGLALATGASEELGAGAAAGAGRDSAVLLPTARRLALERTMLKGVPHLLAALAGILEKNAQKEGQLNPPPSPTSGIPQTSALPDLLANAHDATSHKALDMEIVIKCLSTLQHLFSWLPLSSHVPPSLVSTVFFWGSIATQTQSADAALAGLGGVCELLYRRYAPPSSGTTALRLHHCALQLLRHVTHSQPNMHSATEQYLNKLAEFLRLFVSLHFKRLEAEPEFDAIEFLSYLFQYTFQVPTCTTFVNCLEIWIQFIDILKPEDTAKYWEALRGLVNGVFLKIQFQHNREQLRLLDNEVTDDDGETEWQTFLKHCIECIARVADLAPVDVFSLVLERWQCLIGIHGRASSRAPSGAESDRLLAALLDLATITRALGRLAATLFAESGSESAGRALVGALVERSAQALREHAACACSERHAHAHRHVTAELLACLGACACYVPSCSTAPLPAALLALAARPLQPHYTESPLICHAAAHLLLSLSKNVKFTSHPLAIIGDIYHQALRSLSYLEPKTAAIVREALLTFTLSGVRGAGGASGGGAAAGNPPAARALLAAWASPGAPLPPLTALLPAFQHAPVHAKKIIAEGVLGIAEQALRALCDPAAAGPAAQDAEITDFFFALFSSVLQQLGPFTYTAIECFLQVAQRGESESSIERLVECVRLGVEQDARRVSVRDVLALCTRPAPAPARAQARLLHSVLVHRWRYFFPNSCGAGAAAGGGAEGGAEAARLEEVRVALTALGRALLDDDIEVFRTTIETLDTLNTKWRLYHKAIFRSEFLSEFLSVLLMCVCAGGGGRALLREEVLCAVHAMASVDFTAFRTAFLPRYLAALPGLPPRHVPRLPPDTDLPTFTQNIQRLMNDVNCYRAYSALLPSDEMPTDAAVDSECSEMPIAT